jgi:hypothetical protein
VSPDAAFLNLWRVFKFFGVVYLAVMTSFGICFRWNNATTNFYFFFDYFVDAFFIADIALTFRLGFFIDGRLVMNAEKIESRYLSTWFAVDLLAALPLDFFQLIAGEVSK